MDRERSPHSDDFIFKTSANEKTYDFSTNISGILWALGVYFFLKGSNLLFFAISSALLSVFIPYLFFTKKDKLTRSNAKLYSLDMSSYVIVADFLAKYVNYGFAASVIGIFNKLENEKSVLSAGFLALAHVVAFWISRHIYWRFGEVERERIISKEGENDKN